MGGTVRSGARTDPSTSGASGWEPRETTARASVSPSRLLSVPDQFAPHRPCHFRVRPLPQGRQPRDPKALREAGVAIDRVQGGAVGARVGRPRQIGAARTLPHEQQGRTRRDGHELALKSQACPVLPVLAVFEIDAELAGGLDGFTSDQQMAAVGEQVAGQQPFQQTALRRRARTAGRPRSSRPGRSAARLRPPRGPRRGFRPAVPGRAGASQSSPSRNRKASGRSCKGIARDVPSGPRARMGRGTPNQRCRCWRCRRWQNPGWPCQIRPWHESRAFCPLVRVASRGVSDQSSPDPGISGCGHSGVPLTDQPDSQVLESCANRCRRVGGAVVDDHQGPISMRLVEHRLDGSRQERRDVVSGYDDGDMHGHSPRGRRQPPYPPR